MKPFSTTMRRGLMATAATILGLSLAAAAPPAARAEETSYRARYHFTVPDHWKNDPQRPVYVDGEFHYYYLYNSQYDANPSANYGTEWRLATSKDGVVFADQGVAAPKLTNANYDLWSGSAVVDANNTAGFGPGAVVMLVTQMDHPTSAQTADASGTQAQFLWYSVDKGRHFRPYGDTAVIPNYGNRDFRDPKLIWDADRGRWLALIAEGQKIGFYASSNLKDWTRVSEYVNTTLGTLECPDLFQLRADDNSVKWVLGISANGYLTGAPNTYAYWTGSFDGTSFTPDQAAPQWLDHGFDWYGAVTWENPQSPLDHRYAVGWMNNWSYPHVTPTLAADGFNGTDSITRDIQLKRSGSSYSLVSQPVAALAGIATATHDLGTVRVNGSTVLPYQGASYRLDADVTWDTASNIGVQLRRSADGQHHIDAGICNDFGYLNRGGTGNPGGGKAESHTPFDPSRDQVHLTILVDTTTVEFFIDDGRYVHSSQAFPAPEDKGIALYSADGSATFANLTITEYADIAQRPARLIADFEGDGFGSGFSATGDFVSLAPVTADLNGQVGKKVVDTFAGGDAAIGSITSAPFTIDRDFLHFLIAGGNHPLGVEPATSVQLLVDGAPARTATGDNSATLRPVAWDVSDLVGRTAAFQILDDSTSSAWGHLMVDHVTLSD